MRRYTVNLDKVKRLKATMWVYNRQFQWAREAEIERQRERERERERSKE